MCFVCVIYFRSSGALRKMFNFPIHGSCILNCRRYQFRRYVRRPQCMYYITQWSQRSDMQAHGYEQIQLTKIVVYLPSYVYICVAGWYVCVLKTFVPRWSTGVSCTPLYCVQLVECVCKHCSSLSYQRWAAVSTINALRFWQCVWKRGGG